jgi:hypothetical protein
MVERLIEMTKRIDATHKAGSPWEEQQLIAASSDLVECQCHSFSEAFQFISFRMFAMCTSTHDQFFARLSAIVACRWKAKSNAATSWFGYRNSHDCSEISYWMERWYLPDYMSRNSAKPAYRHADDNPLLAASSIHCCLNLSAPVWTSILS